TNGIWKASKRRGDGAVVLQRIDGAAQGREVGCRIAWHGGQMATDLARDPGRDMLAVLWISRAAVSLTQQMDPEGLAGKPVGQPVHAAGEPGPVASLMFDGAGDAI